MKLESIHHRLGGHLATLCLASSATLLHAVDVNGIWEATDGYTELAVQATTSNWGGGNTLANLHATQDGSRLAVFLGGRSNGNGIILFIDSKSGGASTIASNQITSGGEEYTINNLGPAGSDAGMTFENGFTPDYAVRIYGDGNNAYVNRYDLQAGTRAYVGQSVANALPPSGFVSEIRTSWQDAVAPFASVINGVEMKLSLAGLGVPTGNGQPIKMMAVLVNGGSDYGSNQVLGSRTSSTADIAGAINNINFETEAGVQTLSLTVDNLDTDGDGDPDLTDPDDDNDGLNDVVETDTGIYNSPTDTGTDPLIEDSDGDSYMDGDEVNATLGYISNPNKANYTTMAVPGGFTTPAWVSDGSAGNSMTQVGTSLTTQYQWTLDYRFQTLGSFEYKFTADPGYAHAWPAGFGNYSSTVFATGFHTFTFDHSTVTRSFVRKTFANSAAFLSAYGVVAGGDDDGDTINNENEFAGNTDPTNADTDGDGASDAVDASPLLATRNVVFTVNMSVQEALGNFNPASGGVVVKFFTGLVGGLPDLTLTEVGDTGIYTGTLSNLAGALNANSGAYKFFNTTAGAPNSGYEEGADRSFDLGAANVTQTLPTVFFSNNSTLPGGFNSWSAANAGGQTADQDFDGDGVDNGVEYFMGQTGSSFTANPQPGAGRVVTWPRDPAATGVSFRILSSNDLSTWTDVTGAADTSDPNSVKYTIPASAVPIFVRLAVSNP